MHPEKTINNFTYVKNFFILNTQYALFCRAFVLQIILQHNLPFVQVILKVTHYGQQFGVLDFGQILLKT